MIRILSSLTVLVLCPVLGADDKKDEKKIDPKLLIGKWEKKEGNSYVTEFRKDGKLVVTVSGNGAEHSFEYGYEIDGDKLITISKSGGKDSRQSKTITKLTDSALVTKTEEGKETTYIRIEDKKDEKVDPKLLVGKWHPKDESLRFMRFEFAKDGKMTMATGVVFSSKEVITSGTYKVDGKKIVMSIEESTTSLPVAKLTNTELVEAMDKDNTVFGKELVLVRIKESDKK